MSLIKKKISKNQSALTWHNNNSILQFMLASFIVLMASLVWYDRNMGNYYVFSHKEFHTIVNRALARTLPLHTGIPYDNIETYPAPLSLPALRPYIRNPTTNQTRALFEATVEELVKTYPNVKWNLDEEWVFNNAGGAMGAMWILHASISEYVIIFGTPLGTEGHSGRHLADDYFNILVGEQWTYIPGQGPLGVRKLVYPPGSSNHLGRGKVFQYKMHEGCFALELAQGWIPSMMFFGFADFLSSTQDWWTLWRTTWITINLMIENMLVGKF